jgi:hypothetical protein
MCACWQDDIEGSAAKSAAINGRGLEDASEEGSQKEGMGQIYKAFAILPASKPVPLPFD